MIKPSRIFGLLLIDGGQRRVVGIDDEHGEQLGWFTLARVATDQMMRAGSFIEALARAGPRGTRVAACLRLGALATFDLVLLC